MHPQQRLELFYLIRDAQLTTVPTQTLLLERMALRANEYHVVSAPLNKLAKDMSKSYTATIDAIRALKSAGLVSEVQRANNGVATYLINVAKLREAAQKNTTPAY